MIRTTYRIHRPGGTNPTLTTKADVAEHFSRLGLRVTAESEGTQ